MTFPLLATEPQLLCVSIYRLDTKLLDVAGAAAAASGQTNNIHRMNFNHLASTEWQSAGKIVPTPLPAKAAQSDAQGVQGDWDDDDEDDDGGGGGGGAVKKEKQVPVAPAVVFQRTVSVLESGPFVDAALTELLKGAASSLPAAAGAGAAEAADPPARTASPGPSSSSSSSSAPSSLAAAVGLARNYRLVLFTVGSKGFSSPSAPEVAIPTVLRVDLDPSDPSAAAFTFVDAGSATSRVAVAGTVLALAAAAPARCARAARSCRRCLALALLRTACGGCVCVGQVGVLRAVRLLSVAVQNSAKQLAVGDRRGSPSFFFFAPRSSRAAPLLPRVFFPSLT